MTATKKAQALGKLAELLERQGVEVDSIGAVEKINIWQGFYKGEDGEAHTVDQVGIQLSPKWETGPAWPLVQPAAPRRARPSGRRLAAEDGWETAVILPDPQIGYRAHADGTTEEFHDEAAIAVALAITKTLRPHRIVNLGDTLDFPEWSSKFRQEAAFARTTQATIDRAHEYAVQQRNASTDETQIDWLEGNHDARLRFGIIDNAKAAFGLRRAGEPDDWPVLSVPHLLRLNELGVTYHEGYPAGRVWINDNLACIHGVHLKSSKMLAEESASLLHGHTHRVYRESLTRAVRGGRKVTTIASPGCLCRVDGGVPSVRGGQDSRGKSVPVTENWQQGLAVVRYEPAGAQRWSMELVDIDSGRATFRGKVYQA